MTSTFFCVSSIPLLSFDISIYICSLLSVMCSHPPVLVNANITLLLVLVHLHILQEMLIFILKLVMV